MSFENEQHVHESFFREGKIGDIQHYLKSLTKSGAIPSEVFLDQATAITDTAEADLMSKNLDLCLHKKHRATDQQNTILLSSINLTNIQTRRQTRRVKLQADQSDLDYLPTVAEIDLQKTIATHLPDPYLPHLNTASDISDQR